MYLDFYLLKTTRFEHGKSPNTYGKLLKTRFVFRWGATLRWVSVYHVPQLNEMAFFTLILDGGVVSWHCELKQSSFFR